MSRQAQVIQVLNDLVLEEGRIDREVARWFMGNIASFKIATAWRYTGAPTRPEPQGRLYMGRSYVAHIEPVAGYSAFLEGTEQGPSWTWSVTEPPQFCGAHAEAHRGFAASREDARAAVDEKLRSLGWVLSDRED